MPKFDYSYGLSLDELLDVPPPVTPTDFCSFWQSCYKQIEGITSDAQMAFTGRQVGLFDLYDLSFKSSNNVQINGWVLIPSNQPIRRVLIVGHGYGGCDEPNGNVPLEDAAYLYICYRGLALSRLDGVPVDPNYHVLYDIHDRDSYILRGCVEDTWMAVTTAQELFPDVKDHIGYMGISFSGGIAALALPWEKRIKKAHLQVPSFGNQPLRLELRTWGSAKAVQKFHKKHPEVDTLANLSYFDAASAATFIEVPVHIAAALFDPVVAPPGQFSIYNNLSAEKQLFVLEKGHADYPNMDEEQRNLLSELNGFFNDL